MMPLQKGLSQTRTENTGVEASSLGLGAPLLQLLLQQVNGRLHGLRVPISFPLLLVELQGAEAVASSCQCHGSLSHGSPCERGELSDSEGARGARDSDATSHGLGPASPWIPRNARRGPQSPSPCRSRRPEASAAFQSRSSALKCQLE
jgi:hypothetical protein